MKLTDSEILDYYTLRMKAPRLKKYGEVVRLLGGFGKLKVTRTYTRLDDNGNSSDKVIDSYLLVKVIDGNSLISVDSVPYLDLCVDGSVIRAKDVEDIWFDECGNKYIKNPDIQLDDKHIEMWPK